jgi:hypothetical protein
MGQGLDSFPNSADTYKNTDDFYLYATVLLDKLRLFNEKEDIDGEMKELETLKSVEDNSAFLSRIFYTYINRHLIYNDDDNKYRFNVDDLSTEIKALEIERAKEEQKTRELEYEIIGRPLRKTLRQTQSMIYSLHSRNNDTRVRPTNTGQGATGVEVRTTRTQVPTALLDNSYKYDWTFYR